jgi:signal transduction histidine kinase
LLLLSAILIGTFTVWYTNGFIDELKQGERKKMEIWAEAIRVLTVSNGNESNAMMNLINMVIAENKTIPVILTDSSNNVLSYNNLSTKSATNDEIIASELLEMQQNGYRIMINLGEGDKQHLYYQDSILLQQLTWFPLIQLLVVSIFIVVAYLAFSGTRKAEQDQVWVGMAKETAHQLGTPTSSLLAWIDLLKMKMSDSELINEMEKDVARLRVITDRFSKIGAHTELSPVILEKEIATTLDYLKKRTSSQVSFHLSAPHDQLICAKINSVLFEWVIENLCKNAIDAMEGKGTITINILTVKKHVWIDVKDTGKGIARNRFKTVFQPGFTTKKRGWGLGLTLVKRIVEQYHKGKIFVADSQPGSGTTFRIILPRYETDERAAPA